MDAHLSHVHHMLRPLRVSMIVVPLLTTLSGCEADRRGAADSSVVRDTALARDLEIAQRGPGSERTSDGRDSSQVTASSGMLDSSMDAGANSVAESSARNASSTSTPSAEGFIGPSCASPAPDDQRRCLLGYLARSDLELDRNYQALITQLKLDRNYQALITQLKSEARTRKDAAEPPAVQRLRTAQRSWLTYRDEECRKRTRADEGPLWAPVRAKCLAEYSSLRARELDDALAKRRALAARDDSAKSRSTSGRRSTRQRGRRG
jgi:uncharacterized protein YecT (DUF1311 family)